MSFCELVGGQRSLCASVDHGCHFGTRITIRLARWKAAAALKIRPVPNGRRSHRSDAVFRDAGQESAMQVFYNLRAVFYKRLGRKLT